MRTRSPAHDARHSTRPAAVAGAGIPVIAGGVCVAGQPGAAQVVAVVFSFVVAASATPAPERLRAVRSRAWERPGDDEAPEREALHGDGDGDGDVHRDDDAYAHRDREATGGGAGDDEDVGGSWVRGSQTGRAWVWGREAGRAWSRGDPGRVRARVARARLGVPLGLIVKMAFMALLIGAASLATGAWWVGLAGAPLGAQLCVAEARRRHVLAYSAT